MNLLIRKYLPSKTKLIVSLFIFFSILKTAESYSQWILQYNSPLAISDVRFINKKTGWACGNNQILKTTNGGDKWILQSVPTIGYFRQVHPVNDSVVYVCGWYVILKTSDGGNKWNIVRVGQEQAPQLDGLWFNDENTGWFCGDRVVMRTTNGGKTFIDSARLSNSTYDIHFKNDSTGVIAGYSKMFRTTNSGTNWYSVILPSTIATPFCDRVTFIGDTGWTASWGNIVFRTTNYGISWDSISRIADEHTHSTSSIEFSSSVIGYAGGRYGKIFKTTNGGYNWRILQTDQFGLGDYVSIYTFNDSLVWAVGGGGNIINTKNGGELLVKIPETGFNEISEFTLLQNYPNPFNPATKIEYAIPKDNFVNIKIYNLLGKEIMSLVDDLKKAGRYEISFDGSNLPSGVYYYKIKVGSPREAGGFEQVRKMLLIK
ncbi:MAG: YCF48-related protein [Ignavibacteria bacterium]